MAGIRMDLIRLIRNGAIWAGLLAGLAVLSSSLAIAQTLDAVRARGHLVCASTDPLPGFAQQSDDGLWSGFDVDTCRAVAAAVFGRPDLVEFVPLDGNSRPAMLQTGAVDLIARNANWTMKRDTSFGTNFAVGSFYDGQGFLVPQSLGIVSAYELNDISICVLDGGEERTSLATFFFETQGLYTEILYEDREDLAVAYRAGLCEALSAPVSWLYGIKRSLAEPALHRILPERISKALTGPVVREGDDQWLDIVRWTLFAIINAEELGVTSLNTESLADSRSPAVRRLLGLEGDFGAALGLDAAWMRNVIVAVGNYGEIFDRNFGPQAGPAMLRSQNALWTQGGLLFAPPVR